MQLVITRPDGSRTTVELRKDALTLGRATDNRLPYPDDPALSRYHLCLDPLDGGWQVRDCGSRNGTVVNSTTLTAPHRLHPGDRIYAGHLTIDVHDSQDQGTERVVRFIPQDAAEPKRGATIITSLDEVLGQARKADRGRADSSLTSTRAVRALIRAGQELAGHRPLDELFGVILDLALAAVDARRGVILTDENGNLVIRASRGEGFSISTRLRDQILHERSALLIKDAQLDSALRNQQSIIAQRVRSIVAAPLQTDDRVIGLIYVDNGTTFRPFSHEDLDLLTVMANVAAIRIEHARLAAVEQQEKVTQSELAQAGEIQQSLLPSEAPRVRGYELAGFNLPCRAVGGDYYDFLSYSDGRLGVLIADVCGKGLGAALMMSSLQARVQMLVEARPDCAGALTALNRNLAPRFPIGRFITAFYALLDGDTGALQYANAGHNYPLVLRQTGDVEWVREGALVLGLCDGIQYENHRLTLNPGDLLVLYSDGVTEALSPQGEQLGEKRLADFLAENCADNCSRLTEKLVSYVRGWCGSPALADDFTIVLVRRN